MSNSQFYPLLQRGVSTDVRATLAQLLEAAQNIPANTGTAQRPADMQVCFDMNFLATAVRQVVEYTNSNGEPLENCSKEQAVATLCQAVKLLHQKGWSTTSDAVLCSRVGIQLPAGFGQSLQKDAVGVNGVSAKVNADIGIDAMDPNEIAAPRIVM